MPNQMKKYFQLAPDMPVSRYKQETRPSKGMSERFLRNAVAARATQMNQNKMVAIFTAGV